VDPTRSWPSRVKQTGHRTGSRQSATTPPPLTVTALARRVFVDPSGRFSSEKADILPRSPGRPRSTLALGLATRLQVSTSQLLVQRTLRTHVVARLRLISL
jgi:hypothetical protein